MRILTQTRLYTTRACTLILTHSSPTLTHSHVLKHIDSLHAHRAQRRGNGIRRLLAAAATDGRRLTPRLALVAASTGRGTVRLQLGFADQGVCLCVCAYSDKRVSNFSLVIQVKVLVCVNVSARETSISVRILFNLSHSQTLFLFLTYTDAAGSHSQQPAAG
jgi:hypothetical protein